MAHVAPTSARTPVTGRGCGRVASALNRREMSPFLAACPLSPRVQEDTERAQAGEPRGAELILVIGNGPVASPNVALKPQYADERQIGSK
ncbi:MAG: hypothetical protein H5T86_03335 [Armatimonadetes bacterium]|nr:hypothetical protein [Armatimonadota bacterium]